MEEHIINLERVSKIIENASIFFKKEGVSSVAELKFILETFLYPINQLWEDMHKKACFEVQLENFQEKIKQEKIKKDL